MLFSVHSPNVKTSNRSAFAPRACAVDRCGRTPVVSDEGPEPRTPLPEALIRFRIFRCFRLRRVGRGGGRLCGGGLLRGAALGSGSER